MYRLRIVPIFIPPLRERRGDIAVLLDHFVAAYSARGPRRLEHIGPDAMRALLDHQWPGNVRELANVIEHATILCESLPIGTEDLPRHFGKRQLRKEIRDTGPMTLRELEMIAIDRAIERNDGNKPAAAEELGVSLKTLYNKLNAAEEKKQAG